MEPNRPKMVKTCGTCFARFVTHKAKAQRCPTCISEKRKVRYQSCLECSQPFVAHSHSQRHCEACQDYLQQSPALRPTTGPSLNKNALERFIEHRDQLVNYLDERGAIHRDRQHTYPNPYDADTLGLI